MLQANNKMLIYIYIYIYIYVCVCVYIYIYCRGLWFFLAHLVS